MEYEGDERSLTIEELEEILIEVYGESEYDRTSGCYINRTWLSIDNVLGEVSARI